MENIFIDQIIIFVKKDGGVEKRKPKGFNMDARGGGRPSVTSIKFNKFRRVCTQ